MRMSSTLMPFTALGVGLALALAPGTLMAQEEAAQACTATLAPAEIAAGQAAVRVSFTLSTEPVAFTELIAPEDSRIRLASPEDIPRQEMANPEEAPHPIGMSNDMPNTVVVWLDTSETSPGAYEVTLRGGEHTCKGKVSVTGG